MPARPPQRARRRHAHGLCASHRRRLRAIRREPRRGAQAGTDRARQAAASRIGAHHRAPDGTAVRRGHGGTGRRRAGRVQPRAAVGQPRHARPRVDQLARPGRRAQALVPPSRPAPPTDMRLPGPRRRRPARPSPSRRGRGWGSAPRACANSSWSTSCATSTAWPAGSSTTRIPLPGRRFPVSGAAARRRLPPHVSRRVARVRRAACRNPLRRLATSRCRCRRDEKALRRMLQRALPLTVLYAIPARPPAGGGQVRPGARRAPRAGPQRRGHFRVAEYVVAHAAPPVEGGRRGPAAVEGRGALRAGEGPALSRRPGRSSEVAAAAGFRERRKFPARVPAMDRAEPGGIQAGCAAGVIARCVVRRARTAGQAARPARCRASTRGGGAHGCAGVRGRRGGGPGEGSRPAVLARRTRPHTSARPCTRPAPACLVEALRTTAGRLVDAAPIRRRRSSSPAVWLDSSARTCGPGLAAAEGRGVDGRCRRRRRSVGGRGPQA